jgi:hypothetical protein
VDFCLVARRFLVAWYGPCRIFYFLWVLHQHFLIASMSFLYLVQIILQCLTIRVYTICKCNVCCTLNVVSCTLHTQNIQSLMQPEFLFILILPRHISAALGHHQVLLLKLSHCNFYIICSFWYELLFICLMLRPTLFPSSTSPLLVFTVLKILKMYVSVINFF